MLHEILERLPKLFTGNKKEFLTAKEVKEILRCSDSTLSNYRNNNILSAKKVGGRFYYSQSDNVFDKALSNAYQYAKIMITWDLVHYLFCSQKIISGTILSVPMVATWSSLLGIKRAFFPKLTDFLDLSGLLQQVSGIIQIIKLLYIITICFIFKVLTTTLNLL